MRNVLKYLMLLVSWPAFSGGMSWDVSFMEFSRISATEAEATIKILSAVKSFNDGCDTAKIVFTFDDDEVKKHTYKIFVNIMSQASALDEFEKAAKEGTNTKLGRMGSGLRKTGKCTFTSKGLAPIQEYNGIKVIYSFHDSI